MGREEPPNPASARAPEDAPPPYTEVPAGAASTSASANPPAREAKQSHQAAPQHAQVNRQFPPQFSLYRASTFGKSFSLGEHQNQPLYAVTTHTGWSGQPDVVLHCGPSEASPPLAGVDSGAFTRSATVTLPPLPGSARGSGEEPVGFSGFAHGTHSFSIEIGHDGHREPFEWRHSHGADVDSIGGSSSGWKLVRLAGDAPGGSGGRGSDGKEVVAVWANIRMSITKELTFRFLGSGATGMLGERWAVMAVVTALRIWDKERKQNNSSS